MSLKLIENTLKQIPGVTVKISQEYKYSWTCRIFLNTAASQNNASKIRNKAVNLFEAEGYLIEDDRIKGDEIEVFVSNSANSSVQIRNAITSLESPVRESIVRLGKIQGKKAANLIRVLKVLEKMMSEV